MAQSTGPQTEPFNKKPQWLFITGVLFGLNLTSRLVRCRVLRLRVGLIGLVSLIFGARYLPKLQHQDLQTSAQQIARERGLDTDAHRKVYLPVIRAYRVGPELVAWADGKNLLANPDGDAVLQMGDEISLVGYPDAHARLDPSFRNGKEVFDRDLLDRRIVTEEGVVKNHNVVGRRLAQLKLTDHGCFLNRVIRSQIEMPIDDNIVLNKGDVLQVSGDARRVKTIADRIGFISIHSQVTDLLAFCAFFIVGLMIGMITFQFSSFSFGVGNAAGLLFAGIMLGFLRANHPTFGYIPQGALIVNAYLQFAREGGKVLISLQAEAVRSGFQGRG